MSWKSLEHQGRIERHKTSKIELDELRLAIERNLRDAALPGLSADNRFGLTYEAALLLARMAALCAGYRPKGLGAHETTFLTLELTLGPSAARMGKYLNKCRRKRNELSYEAAGIATDSEADELTREVTRLRSSVEAWISEKHPPLSSSG